MDYYRAAAEIKVCLTSSIWNFSAIGVPNLKVALHEN